MEVKTYGMVLRLSWLKPIHHARWDYDKLSMTFWYDWKMCKLQPQELIGCKIVDFKKIENDLEAVGQVFMLLQLVENGDEKLFYFQLQGENGFAKAVQGMLTEFSDVFKEPKSLPPLREGHNHPIILQGSDLVNLRPYRHLAAQKNAIEDIVKELLQSQVIQESSSPFASPLCW